MAVIDFTADVGGIGFDPTTDGVYAAIDAARTDGASEASILTMVEVMRAYMAELTDESEARMFHHAMGRMLATMSYSAGTYNGDSTITASDIADNARDAAIAVFERESNPSDLA